MRITNILLTGLTIAFVMAASFAITNHAFVSAVTISGDDDGPFPDDDDGPLCLLDGGDDGLTGDGEEGEFEGDADGDHQVEPDDCTERPTIAPYNGCDGNTPGAYFYYETDYQGDCFRVSADTPFFYNDNDQASSIRLVGIGTIIICQHSGYQGYCIGVETDIPDLGTTNPPSNNDLSSAYFDGLPPNLQPTPPSDVVLGRKAADVNCDGDVDSADAIGLLRSLSGTGTSSDCDATGDADCSGAVNSADVARILRITAALADTC